VAAIHGQPARAANGCVAVATVAAEAPAVVPAPELAHPPGLPPRGRAAGGAMGTRREPRAALEAAAAQVHVDSSAARARLAHREDAAAERPGLHAAPAAPAAEVHMAEAGVDHPAPGQPRVRA